MAFSLVVVALALWEGLPLWREGFRREAIVGWCLWGVGLILGNMLIVAGPGFSLAPWINRIFTPMGRFLTGD